VGDTLFYLIYESKQTSKLSIAQIKDLANKAAKKNTLLNITGLLVRKNNGFIQYLEGPKTAITMLYEEILRDERHHSVTLLKKGHIIKRKISGWSLSLLLKHVTSEEIQRIESLKTKRPKIFKELEHIENENLKLVISLLKDHENSN